MNIADILKVQQAARPEHPAVECGAAVVSYDRLATLVEGCAARMRKQGVRAGDVVAMDLPDGVEYLVVLYALARIGDRCCPMSGW